MNVLAPWEWMRSVSLLNFGEVRCTVNPDVGYELRKVQIPGNTGRIKIVGAGIKGLESAHQTRAGYTFP